MLYDCWVCFPCNKFHLNLFMMFVSWIWVACCCSLSLWAEFWRWPPRLYAFAGGWRCCKIRRRSFVMSRSILPSGSAFLLLVFFSASIPSPFSMSEWVLPPLPPPCSFYNGLLFHIGILLPRPPCSFASLLATLPPPDLPFPLIPFFLTLSSSLHFCSLPNPFLYHHLSP